MMMMMIIIIRIITGLCRVVVKIADTYTLDYMFEPRPAHMYDGHVHVLLAEGQVFYSGKFGFRLTLLNNRLDMTELS